MVNSREDLAQCLHDLIERLLPWKMVGEILEKHQSRITADLADDELAAVQKRLEDRIMAEIPRYYVKPLLLEFSDIAWELDCTSDEVSNEYGSSFVERYWEIEEDAYPYGKIFVHTIGRTRKIVGTREGDERDRDDQWSEHIPCLCSMFARLVVAVASGRIRPEEAAATAIDDVPDRCVCEGREGGRGVKGAW